MTRDIFLKQCSMITLLFFVFTCLTGNLLLAEKVREFCAPSDFIQEKDEDNIEISPNQEVIKKEQDEGSSKNVIEKPGNKKKKAFPIIWLAVGIAAASAVVFSILQKEPPPDYGLGNTIFARSILIEGFKPEFAERVSATPAFVWKATDQRYVFLGVFKRRIEVNNYRIVNIDDNVWAWHSGLGRGREGNVYFSDGCDVINGELKQDSLPTPLPKGEYYWAIWAWADDGIKISHSSEEMYFIVE